MYSIQFQLVAILLWHYGWLLLLSVFFIFLIRQIHQFKSKVEIISLFMLCIVLSSEHLIVADINLYRCMTS